MALDAAEVWRNCFKNWPADLQRGGVLVTTFGEQIVFDNFAASDELLLIERRAPDNVGARFVIVGYHNVQAMKVTEVVKLKSFQSLGFVAPATAPKR